MGNACVFERQSALAGANLQKARHRLDGQPPLRIGEVRGWSLVQIAAFATTLAELKCAVRSLLDVALPSCVGDVVTVGARQLLKTGSTQFWIISRDGEDLTSVLRAAVAPTIGAVTPLSHARTCIYVDGSAARELLSCIAIDFHPSVFHRNCFALTALHHTPVLVHRSNENRYELFLLRTFAQSAWEWLADAAMPFGYVIANEGS